MAEQEKDLNKKTKSTSTKKVDAKVSEQENKSKKLVDDAKKSLTSKKEVKTEQKPKKENQVKDMTSYQEQALQGVTKDKKNKKLLLIILLLVGLVVVAGVAIALIFLLRPEEEPQKAVVCNVEVLTYAVNLGTEQYIVTSSVGEFDFNQGTETTSHFTKDIEENINEVYDIALVYLVNNTTSNNYVYTFDFSNIVFENCEANVKINNGQTYTINDQRKVISITQTGDVTLEVRFSVIDEGIADETNTKCEGGIDLTLSIA